MHQDVKIYFSHLEKHIELSYTLNTHRVAWLQLITGELQLNDDVFITAGDGAAITHVMLIHLEAEKILASCFLISLLKKVNIKH